MTLQKIEQDNASFTCKNFGSIELITFTGHPISMLMSTGEKEKFLLHIGHLDNDSSSKVVILYSPNNSLGKESFWDVINSWSKSKICTDTILTMCKALDQVMLRIIESPKIFISAQSGKVIFPFFGLSLACDYRMVANNYTVQNPEPVVGLAPKGAEAFFLPKILGTSAALELMLSSKDLNAYELFRLKLVDRVVEFNKLQQEAIKKANDYASKPCTALVSVKRLINCCSKSISDYLEFENDLLVRNLNALNARH